MNKVNISGVLFFGFVGFCSYTWSIWKENNEFLIIAIVLWAAIALYTLVVIYNRYSRKKYIYAKYPDKAIADAILNGQFWQGQTRIQLLDSIGRPLDIDTKILKTKKKETWKYNSFGKNRYGLKITLENDCVIGWDKKA